MTSKSLFTRGSYALSEIRSNYDDQHWWRGRIKNRVVSPFHTRIYPRYRNSIRIMEEDWDNLLILDACRADAFEEVADTSRFDDYRRVTSIGSATPEWTERNFEGMSFGDTLYVSANPHTSMIAGDSFNELVEVWKTDYDDDFGAVYPDDVTDAALQSARDDKRMIVHYIQPHPPFVEESLEYQFTGWDPLVHGDSSDPEIGFWQALEEGLLSRDEVWDAYCRNLDAVLEEARGLVDGLDGKTILTSDHGTLFGERLWPVPMRGYSHARRLRHPKLTTVPWAVSDGNRREITDDGTNPVERSEDDMINERLAALGYVPDQDE